jgi:rhodanese-related sulfurtransferase
MIEPALPSDGYEVSVQQVESWLPAVERGEITLIDCREQEEWDIGHLPHARLFPLSRFAEIKAPEGPVIVYCHHGMRSMRATLYLRQLGNSEVWSMAGGSDAWSQEIDPALPRY